MGGSDGDGSTINCPTSTVWSSHPLRFTDFSNHLGIMMEADDDDPPVMIVDPDAPAHPAGEDDIYGWEAELRRKTMAAPFTTTGAVSSCRRGCQDRPAGGEKRDLLRRVGAYLAGHRMSGINFLAAYDTPPSLAANSLGLES